MSLLRYEGVSAGGADVSGQFSGSRDELLKDLQQKGVVVTSIIEEREKLKKGKFGLADFRSNIEQLHYLLEAGVQVDAALSLMSSNSNKLTEREFCQISLSKLKEGTPLSLALQEGAAKVNYTLPHFYLNMIAVGEEVGDLKGAFKGLLHHLEFKGSLDKEVRAAVAYPAFLSVASFLTFIFVLGFILPRFSTIYSPDEISRLPFISKVTLSVGSYLNGHLLPFFLLVALLLGSLFMAWNNSVLRQQGRRLMYHLPLIRDLVLLLEFSNLFAALGVMLKGGVGLSRAIKLSAKVVNSPALTGLLAETDLGLKRGNKISQIWSRHAVVPGEVVSLVVVGETGARLQEVFARAGEKYLERFKARISLFLTFLEPAIIVILGVFIGFIVVAIMLAVVSMSDIYG